MKQVKDLWIESVMNSHQGKMKLRPSESLFDRIPMNSNKVRIMSLRQMKIAGVAASLLILINSVAIQSINTSMASESGDIAYEDQLISDYNLYKYE